MVHLCNVKYEELTDLWYIYVMWSKEQLTDLWYIYVMWSKEQLTDLSYIYVMWSMKSWPIYRTSM